MNDLRKLQVLLPHWIEHHAEHTDELRTWAERIRRADQADIAEKLLLAAASLQHTADQLSSLMNQVGETITRQQTK